MMSLISQMLSTNKNIDVAMPLSSKTTSDLERVSLYDLETRYKDDPIIYNSVNVRTQTIMAPGYHLLGDKNDIRVIEEFFRNVGSVGGGLPWNEILTRIFQHQFIYGRSWTELIPNVEKTELVDIDIIDPKKMDYLRDSYGNIVLDEYSNPIGYVEKVGGGGEIDSKILPPAPYRLESGQIFLPPDRAVQFIYNTMGDGFEGIGLVEPVYKASVRRDDAESAWANSPIFPMLVSKIGNESHEPTKQHLMSALDELSASKKRSVFTYPYWVELEMLQAKQPEKVIDQFKHYEDAEIAGLGLAKAFAKWEGGETNRDTLARQEFMLKISLKNTAFKTCERIMRQIFGKMLEFGQIKSIPVMVWNEIALQELDSKADRIVQYLGSGGLTPDSDLEKYIRTVERLPPKMESKETEKEVEVTPKEKIKKDIDKEKKDKEIEDKEEADD